jgi:DNA primase
MREVLDGARPLVDMLWDLELAAGPADTPERRAGFRQRLRERVRLIGERTVQEDYRSEIEHRLAGAFPVPGRRREGAGPGRPPPSRGGRPAAADVGGMAARQGVRGLERQPEEIVLALLVNHPQLAAEHAEELAAAAFQAGGLDKLRRAIIDLAAGEPDLDSDALKRHLTQKGFAQALQGLLDRTKDKRFTLPTAAAERAADGLREQLGLMRERAARRERELAARQLADDPTDESFARFETVRQATLEGESRREDVDALDSRPLGLRST